jgi:hypothetical protein
MKPVAELLSKARLGHLSPSSQPVEESIAAADASLGAPMSMTDSRSRRNDDEFAGMVEAAAQLPPAGTANSGEYVGAEIVCIVRPKTPGAISRVVIVNQASSRFVDDLLHESGGSRRETASADRTNPEKRIASNKEQAAPRVAMQKPDVNETGDRSSRGPIETSFEPQRYRRSRD